MRCPVCGSERLGPLGELGAYDPAGFSLVLRYAAPKLFSRTPRFAVGYGRACLDCGTLTAFMNDEEREKLAEAADRLELPKYLSQPGTPRSPGSPS
ncbi:hypothetical protein ACWED2_01240 [Amycolatopsis sp. NPDC005003]